MRRSAARSRVAIALSAALSALACLAPLPRFVRAADRDAPPIVVELALPACDPAPFSALEVRDRLGRLLRAEDATLSTIELRAIDADLHGAISWGCDATTDRALVELRTNDGERLDRTIDLSDVRAADRPAVIALAVAEAVRALRARPARVVADEVPASASPHVEPSRPPPAPAPSETSSASETRLPVPQREGAPHTLAFELGPEAQRFASSTPWLLGARIDAAFDRVRFSISVSSTTATDSIGAVDASLMRAAVSWTALRSGGVTFGPIAWLGRASLRASADASAAASRSDDLFAAIGADATATLSLGSNVAIGVGVECGLARGVVAQADDRVVLRVDGGYLSARAILRFSP